MDTLQHSNVNNKSSSSCYNCSKTKSNCDGLIPKCSRCKERDIKCTYKANKSQHTNSNTLADNSNNYSSNNNDNTNNNVKQRSLDSKPKSLLSEDVFDYFKVGLKICLSSVLSLANPYKLGIYAKNLIESNKLICNHDSMLGRIYLSGSMNKQYCNCIAKHFTKKANPNIPKTGWYIISSKQIKPNEELIIYCENSDSCAPWITSVFDSITADRHILLSKAKQNNTNTHNTNNNNQNHRTSTEDGKICCVYSNGETEFQAYAFGLTIDEWSSRPEYKPNPSLQALHCAMFKDSEDVIQSYCYADINATDFDEINTALGANVIQLQYPNDDNNSKETGINTNNNQSDKDDNNTHVNSQFERLFLRHVALFKRMNLERHVKLIEDIRKVRIDRLSEILEFTGGTELDMELDEIPPNEQDDQLINKLLSSHIAHYSQPKVMKLIKQNIISAFIIEEETPSTSQSELNDEDMQHQFSTNNNNSNKSINNIRANNNSKNRVVQSNGSSPTIPSPATIPVLTPISKEKDKINSSVHTHNQPSPLLIGLNNSVNSHNLTTNHRNSKQQSHKSLQSIPNNATQDHDKNNIPTRSNNISAADNINENRNTSKTENNHSSNNNSPPNLNHNEIHSDHEYNHNHIKVGGLTTNQLNGDSAISTKRVRDENSQKSNKKKKKHKRSKDNTNHNNSLNNDITTNSESEVQPHQAYETNLNNIEENEIHNNIDNNIPINDEDSKSEPTNTSNDSGMLGSCKSCGLNRSIETELESYIKLVSVTEQEKNKLRIENRILKKELLKTTFQLQQIKQQLQNINGILK